MNFKLKLKVQKIRSKKYSEFRAYSKQRTKSRYMGVLFLQY